MVVKLNAVSELVSISKGAKLLGVSVSTLRNWEKHGYLLPFRLNSRCHRRYDVYELIRLRQLGVRSYHPVGERRRRGENDLGAVGIRGKK